MDPGLAEITAVELEGHPEQVHIPHLNDRSPGRIGMFSPCRSAVLEMWQQRGMNSAVTSLTQGKRQPAGETFYHNLANPLLHTVWPHRWWWFDKPEAGWSFKNTCSPSHWQTHQSTAASWAGLGMLAGPLKILSTTFAGTSGRPSSMLNCWAAPLESSPVPGGTFSLVTEVEAEPDSGCDFPSWLAASITGKFSSVIAVEEFLCMA